ncbi:hypothetical protein [Orenia marismortui]|uniref:hypothetical protein n=1 Tax=Orenia marismortui TaxID=46469 RepID=UPI00039BB49D|nr:hypothetical protein [Orenia marismortui]
MKKDFGFFKGIKLILTVILLSNILSTISTAIIYRNFYMANAFKLSRIFSNLIYILVLVFIGCFFLDGIKRVINNSNKSIKNYFSVFIMVIGLFLISLKVIKLSNYFFISNTMDLIPIKTNMLLVICILVSTVLLREIIFKGVIFEGFLSRYKSWLAFVLFYLLIYLIPSGLVKMISSILIPAEAKSLIKYNSDTNFLFTYMVAFIVSLMIMWIFYITRDIKLSFFASLLWELCILSFYKLSNHRELFDTLKSKDKWLLLLGVVFFLLGTYCFYNENYTKKELIAKYEKKK